MAKNKNRQKMLPKEDLTLWLGYMLAGQMPVNKKEADQLQKISERPITVADASALMMKINDINERKYALMAEELSVVTIALRNKGTLTEEDVNEARAQYNKELEESMEDMKNKLEELKKAHELAGASDE